jgi:hypothetical protein
MADQLSGQLTILLTTLILAALLAFRKDHKILAGVLVGFSVAIKMFTWPLIIYFIVKKDWRTVISSCLTVVGLNLISLFTLGINPIMDYYLRVMEQVTTIYHSFINNYSLWSIGYRLLEGTTPFGDGSISALPLISLPKLAPFVSAGLVILFLITGLLWAKGSKDPDIAYSIMICVSILISPISWDHYYVLIIIGMTVMWHYLSKHSFPAWKTLIFMMIFIMLALGNNQIDKVIILLNGGADLLQANGNQITFASSLLMCLPILGLIGLTLLLWQSGKNESNETTSYYDLNQNNG